MGLEQELEQYQGHIKKGDVVYVPFPFAAHQQLESLENDQQKANAAEESDFREKPKASIDSNLERGKDRPALVLFRSDQNNFVFCAITKQGYRDPSISLSNRDLGSGKLGFEPSYIKPNIIATIDRKSIRSKIGTLKPEKLAEVITKFKELIDMEPEEIPVSKALERPKRRVR